MGYQACELIELLDGPKVFLLQIVEAAIDYNANSNAIKG